MIDYGLGSGWREVQVLKVLACRRILMRELMKAWPSSGGLAGRSAGAKRNGNLSFTTPAWPSHSTSISFRRWMDDSGLEDPTP